MTKLLAPADAALILGCTPATVRQMERRGELKATRTEGGIRLFRREDVERLLKRRQAQEANDAS